MSPTAQHAGAEKEGKILAQTYRYHVDGNTVRKEQQAPEIRRREDSVEQRKQARRVLRNQNRVLAMSLPQAVLLLALCLIVGYMAFQYILVRSSISATNKVIQNEQAQLTELRQANEALRIRTEASLDLDEIYRVATEELGMVHAGEDQSVYYSKTESEYVRQYDNIPTE